MLTLKTSLQLQVSEKVPMSEPPEDTRRDQGVLSV